MGVVVFLVVGRSVDYVGFCLFNCNLGKIGDKGCLLNICGILEVLLVILIVFFFLLFICMGGWGLVGWEGFCFYVCNFGFCFINICICI